MKRELVEDVSCAAKYVPQTEYSMSWQRTLPALLSRGLTNFRHDGSPSALRRKRPLWHFAIHYPAYPACQAMRTLATESEQICVLILVSH